MHQLLTGMNTKKRASSKFSNWLDKQMDSKRKTQTVLWFSSIDLMRMTEWGGVGSSWTRAELEQATLNDGDRGVQVFSGLTGTQRMMACIHSALSSNDGQLACPGWHVWIPHTTENKLDASLCMHASRHTYIQGCRYPHTHTHSAATC